MIPPKAGTHILSRFKREENDYIAPAGTKYSSPVR